MPLRDIVLTLIIVGLLPVCLRRPWIGVLVWFWVGVMNPHKLTWSFASGMPFAQMVALATLSGMLLTKDRQTIPWNLQLVLIVLLFTHWTATSFFAWAPDPAWEQWTKVAKILLMTFVATMMIYGKDRIRALLLVLGFSIGFYAVKGASFVIRTGGVQMVRGPDQGYIGSNTGIGLAMIMALPLLLCLAREETRTWLRRTLNFTAFCCAFSTPFTYSRGALLGLAATAPLVLFATKRKFLILLLLLPLAYFGKDLVPKELIARTETISEYRQDGSAMFRLQAWSVAWNIAKERPLVGAGFNFEYARGIDARWLSYADFIVPDNENYARATHSIYFQILGQHGFLNAAVYLLLIVSSLWSLQRLRRNVRARPDLEWVGRYAYAIQVSIFGFLVAGAFVSAAYFDLFWLLIALIAILQREVAVAQQAVQPTPASNAQPSAPLAPAPAARMASRG